VIAGAGQTMVGKLPDLDPVQIQALASLNALDDCGMTARDVDGSSTWIRTSSQQHVLVDVRRVPRHRGVLPGDG